MHASTLFRLFRILPIILCLSMALLVTVLLVGCGNSSSGTINVVAGNGSAGFSGNGDTAIDAELNNPVSVAVDSSGNFYIADSENNIVRKVIASSGTISTVAGSVLLGYSGDNGPATSAKLNYPSGVAVDSSGNVYIADFGNNVIRKVTASSGVITTLAGNGTQGYSGDKGLATSAMLSTPSGVAVDSSGNLFIADLGNNVIREVAASSGIITTVAGSGMAGYSGDDGPAASHTQNDIATLNGPRGVAVDSSGNLYIADSGNNIIRKVTASSGIITTVAGLGMLVGDAGDNGPAISASLFDPTGITLDSSGNLYIADEGNNVIRKVTASSGIITTVAGNGEKGDTGNGGSATSATLNGPSGVAVDSAGNIYLADQGNNVIQEVTY